MTKRWRVLAGLGAAAAATWLVIGEGSHAWAHFQGLARPRPGRGGREAIIVLGYPANVDGTPSPLQRWRAQIAARSADPAASATVFICSGAVDHSGRSEAEALAELLTGRGVPTSQIILETRAASTWQNLQYSAPLAAGADVVKVASNSLHAWRGRRFLRRQDPALAARLAPAHDYRFGEHWWLKTPLAIYEAVGAWREWRNPRLPA